MFLIKELIAISNSASLLLNVHVSALLVALLFREVFFVGVVVREDGVWWASCGGGARCGGGGGYWLANFGGGFVL